LPRSAPQPHFFAKNRRLIYALAPLPQNCRQPHGRTDALQCARCRWAPTGCSVETCARLRRIHIFSQRTAPDLCACAFASKLPATPLTHSRTDALQCALCRRAPTGCPAGTCARLRRIHFFLQKNRRGIRALVIYFSKWPTTNGPESSRQAVSSRTEARPCLAEAKLKPHWTCPGGALALSRAVQQTPRAVPGPFAPCASFNARSSLPIVHCAFKPSFIVHWSLQGAQGAVKRSLHPIGAENNKPGAVMEIAL
jgi:hypothetical protein